MAIVRFPELFDSFGSFFSRIWTFSRNYIERYHHTFFLSFAFIAVRLGIYFCSLFWTSIYRFIVLTRNAITTVSSNAGGLSALQAFDLVNTIFPVYELFVFLSTLLTIKSVYLGYSFLRGLYKQIPFKAT